jgi:hypothetical protein
MSSRTKLFVISLLVLALVGLTSFTDSQAFTDRDAQPVQSEQTLQALLSEVHLLRLAIQRANLNTYNAQITIERMKLSQQRVDRLQVQLGNIRNQLVETRKRMSEMSADIKGTEEVNSKETDETMRINREGVIRGRKAELEELIQKELQEQGYETLLNGQLQIEQAKLSELNERLDILQRELETQISTDKPQQSGKPPEKD